MVRWALLALLALQARCGDAGSSHGSLAPGAMTEAVLTSASAPKPHLDELHDALLEGRPARTPVRAPPRLAMWAPQGQEQQAASAVADWQDGWADRSAAVVREVAQDDDDFDAEQQEDDGVALSPTWLRGVLGTRAVADEPENELVGGVPRTPRVSSSPGSQGHFRRKRSPRPGPNEASSEDASVAADSSKRTPPSVAPPASAVPPQQAKAARAHQFVTGRNEEPPPVAREVESSKLPGATKTPPPPPTHASPATSSSSRVGAARDALGLRVNEIPQGPRYESETHRYANDHRHYLSDTYGSNNAYASTYGASYGSSSGGYGGGGYGGGGYSGGGYGGGGYGGGGGGGGGGIGYSGYSGGGSSYGNSGSANNVYPSPALPPPSTAGRSVASSATPRRIIYYASLPEPTPVAPHLQHMPHLQQQYGMPGSARVPHEYRGPPYDVNGAFPDTRYPPPPPPPPGPAADQYRYTIIDAEPPGPVLGGLRTNALPYRDRPPAPAAYPQPYRINPPPPPPPPAPSPTTDTGPQAASPIQYTQYDYNGIGARTASSVALVDSKQGTGPGGMPSGAPGVPLSDDPYRGMNPRQPAPWSMQVGTRLTVKDDGYGNSPGLPPAARRFYVTSQQQPGFGEGPYGHGLGLGSLGASLAAPARFPRPLDRDRTSANANSRAGSEPRNRLFR